MMRIEGDIATNNARFKKKIIIIHFTQNKSIFVYHIHVLLHTFDQRAEALALHNLPLVRHLSNYRR